MRGSVSVYIAMTAGTEGEWYCEVLEIRIVRRKKVATESDGERN